MQALVASGRWHPARDVAAEDKVFGGGSLDPPIEKNWEKRVMFGWK